MAPAKKSTYRVHHASVGKIIISEKTTKQVYDALAAATIALAALTPRPPKRRFGAGGHTQFR